MCAIIQCKSSETVCKFLFISHVSIVSNFFSFGTLIRYFLYLSFHSIIQRKISFIHMFIITYILIQTIIQSYHIRFHSLHIFLFIVPLWVPLLFSDSSVTYYFIETSYYLNSNHVYYFLS